MPNPYYITTPIYYVNDVPHIGHAYTSVSCDVLARFKRLDGYDVLFLTGTDEHGHKVLKSARASGDTPQDFVDRMAGNFAALSESLNLSNDDFIRTTEKRHHKTCQALWRELVKRDQIYLDTYAGWYAVSDEAFYRESDLRETPDGSKIAPSGAVCEWVEEASYFFRLSQWREPLLAYYESEEDVVLPESRRNEVIAFVKEGLQDLSVSRTTFRWGVEVPNDSEHVMYVWVDALTNYLSAIDWFQSDSPYQRFWPAIHMVGKDIVRFHAVYWPALLMAAGVPPPRRIFAHGWWTIEGKKMSKSLGNVIAPEEIVQAYGQDECRYFLLREVPFGQDGDFSQTAIVQRINSDLANDYGNLIQRVLKLIHQEWKQTIPVPETPYTSADALLQENAYHLLDAVRRHIDVQAFHKALEAIWSLISHTNRYIEEQAPWRLAKSDRARMATVLYVSLETIRCLAILTQPFMPKKSSDILESLAIPKDQRGFDALQRALAPGTVLPPPVILFPRR